MQKNILFKAILVLFLFSKINFSNAQSIILTPNGAWVPSMTSTARTALTPTTGQLVYDSSLNLFYYYNGTAWTALSAASGISDNLGNHTATQNINLGSNYLSYDGSNKGLSIGTDGDVTLKSTLNNKFTLGNGTNTVSLLALKNSAQEWRWALGQSVGNPITLTDVTNDNIPFRVFPNTQTSITMNGTNIGINNSSPSERLDVAGKTKTTNFQMTNGASANYILKSDDNGNASWTNANSVFVGDNLGNHTATQNINLGSNYLSYDGTSKGFQMTTTGANLLGDGRTALEMGNSSQSLTGLSLINSSKNYQFVASGTKLLFHEDNLDIDPFVIDSPTSDYSIYIKGGNVGINNSTPTENLHIVGNTLIDGGKLKFTNTGESVFIGDFAGSNDDYTANQNVFVGDGAGNQNVSGSLNTFVGSNAGYANTSSNNVGIGQAALEANIGGSNTAVGRIALGNNINGSSNVAIGEEAGRYSTGSSNVFLGQYSGRNNTGSNNVFIGSSAGENETADQKLYIANTNTTSPLIYGDFDDKKIIINDYLTSKYFQMTNGATSGYVLKSDASGNGTWVNPTSLANGNWTTSGSNQYSALSGNVGIGTTSPSYLLDIAGTSNSMQRLSSSSTTGTWLALTNSSTNGTSWNLISTGSGNSESAGNLLIKDNSVVRMIVQSSTGNVGIGTSSPTAKLDIQGTTQTTANVQSSGSHAYIVNSAPSGSEAALQFKTYSSGTNSTRWAFGKSITAESGSQVGSDFFINSYNDAGVYSATPLTISRSTGIVNIPSLAATTETVTTLTATTANATTLTATTANATTANLTTTNATTINTTTANTTTLNVFGALTLPTTSKTASYALGASDYCVIFTGTTASQTFTFPTSPATGRVILLINHSSQTWTAASSATYTIGNSTTANTITAGSSVQLIYDGTNWQKIN